MSGAPSLAALLLLLGAALITACGESEPAETVDGKSRALWERQLADFAPSAKADALRALARFADPPTEQIAAHLGDKARLVRLGAMEALGHIGPAAVAHATALVGYLEHDPEGMDAAAAKSLRDAAMEALGKLGPGAFRHFSHLLVSDEAPHRARAVYAMRPFAAQLPDGTNTILPLLEDPDAVVRREAVKTLAETGKGDARASEALMEALADPDPSVVAAAAVALGGIGGRSDQEGQALAKLLYAHRQEVRASAAYGLGLMGLEGSPYAQQLADLMANDSRAVVRIQAARAHYRVSGKSALALAQLEREAATDDTGLKHDALAALEEIRAAAGSPSAQGTRPGAGGR